MAHFFSRHCWILFVRRATGGLVLVALLCVAVPSSNASLESTNYIIESDVLSTGGAEGAASTNYLLGDSIGESAVLSPTSTSATYGVKAGFRELYPDQYVSLVLSSSNLVLGTLSTTQVTTGTHTLTASTNSVFGIAVTVSGNTLASGLDTITAIGATAQPSVPGTAQFGLNFVANTGFGAVPSGTAPLASVATRYNEANKFAFSSGATVATSTAAINPTTFTVSYIVNIPAATPNGTYSTTLTYAATATF